MAVKSTLRLVLYAGETVVAETDDPSLWQSVLAKLYSADGGRNLESGVQHVRMPVPEPDSRVGPSEPLEKLAKSLDVTTEALIGACRPRADDPFILIDHHCWEAYKSQTPARGPRSIGATAVVGTLLSLWSRDAELPDATLGMAAKILAKLGARDSYPRRTIRNCNWLQLEGDRIKVNPAKFSLAKRLARAFVLSNWSEVIGKGTTD